MYWKIKAMVLKCISILPSSLSYGVYYRIQRYFDKTWKVIPSSRLKTGVEIWERIMGLGYDPVGKTFFEVGTGRTPIIPLTFWLMGAENIITIDLNPYLKANIIKKSLDYISNNEEIVKSLFGLLLDKKRFRDLIYFHKNISFSTDLFLALCHINYIAPGDAAKTSLAEESIDFHTSYTVFEHIEPTKLKLILEEGNRIIKKNGLFIHRIDYSDHFSHKDKAISYINFLQYSDSKWDRYSGNRYAYHNRLRHDDFLQIFKSIGHSIIVNEPYIDQRCIKSMENNHFALDEKFKNKTKESCCTINAWIISK